VSRQGETLTAEEAKAFAEFVAFAADKWAKSQSELAEKAGVSQGMISIVRSGMKRAGGRTLLGISSATGIPVNEILSGVGLAKLRAGALGSEEQRRAEKRIRACQALAIVFETDFAEFDRLFAEIGLELPTDVPAATWFDVGRAAFERRRAGLALLRQVSINH
jgi:transcriptional regulator with XRE-family HTH domain